jgi:hypothetical protein
MNNIFWYLKSMLQSDGGINKDVKYKIRVGWVKWWQTTDILYDKEVQNKLKSKFYKMMIRLAMIYDVEC